MSVHLHSSVLIVGGTRSGQQRGLLFLDQLPLLTDKLPLLRAAGYLDSGRENKRGISGTCKHRALAWLDSRSTPLEWISFVNGVLCKINRKPLHLLNWISWWEDSVLDYKNWCLSSRSEISLLLIPDKLSEIQAYLQFIHLDPHRFEYAALNMSISSRLQKHLNWLCG